MSSLSPQDQDALTLSQLSSISASIASTTPFLTTEILPLSYLFSSSYASDDEDQGANANAAGAAQGEGEEEKGGSGGGRRTWRKQIEDVGGRYGGYRGVRGDGNCFYRAFVFRLAEVLCAGGEGGKGGKGGNGNGDGNGDGDGNGTTTTSLPPHASPLQRRFFSLITSSLTDCSSAGMDSTTLSVFHDECVDLFASLPSSSPSDVLDLLTDEGGPSEYITWYMRALTAVRLKADVDRFSLYLPEEYFGSMQSFVDKEVLPMGRECDQLQIMALCEYFGVGVEIVYVDGRRETAKVHRLGPEENEVEIVLMYRPGHYDVLYPKAKDKD